MTARPGALRLSGRVALVTGAGRGFGRAIALALAREGADVGAGTMLCTHHVPPAMIERRHGRIINLSSQLAQRAVGGGGFAAYSATKGAIEALTRALADEVGPHDITVNAIAPGYLAGQILHPSGGWVMG